MSKFSALKSQYGGFLAPDFSITVDGKDLKKNLMLSDLSVDLSVGSTCGSCRFSVGKFYEPQSRSIASAVQNSLVLGKVVKISLGYGSNLTPVFTGYLSSLAFQFSGGYSMQASCMDVRGLMRESQKGMTYKNVTEKGVIEQIFGRYEKLIGSNSVKMEDLSEAGDITVDSNDLSYIMKETEKRGLLFFMDDDKACIAKASGNVCVEFEWGEFDLNCTMNYQNKKITGLGYDRDNMKAFKASADSKQAGKQTDCGLAEYVYTLDPHIPEELGKKLVEAMAKSQKRGAQSSKVDCVGLPELKLGQLVEFKDFPLASYTNNSKFLITEISHSLGESGFKTSFTISLEDK